MQTRFRLKWQKFTFEKLFQRHTVSTDPIDLINDLNKSQLHKVSVRSDSLYSSSRGTHDQAGVPPWQGQQQTRQTSFRTPHDPCPQGTLMFSTKISNNKLSELLCSTEEYNAALSARHPWSHCEPTLKHWNSKPKSFSRLTLEVGKPAVQMKNKTVSIIFTILNFQMFSINWSEIVKNTANSCRKFNNL